MNINLFLLVLLALVLSPGEADVLSEESVKACLEEHNKFRTQTANGQTLNKENNALPTASNMNKLVYDKNLEALAEKTIQKCVFEHDSEASGQNLHLISNINLDQTALIKQAIDSWFSEHKNYRGTNTTLVGEGFSAIGHFTQVVNADTDKVGCSTKVCKDNYFVFCDYGGGGNYIGGLIYHPGSVCSECKEGKKCEDSLCA